MLLVWQWWLFLLAASLRKSTKRSMRRWSTNTPLSLTLQCWSEPREPTWMPVMWVLQEHPLLLFLAFCMKRIGKVCREQACKAQNISVSPIREISLFTCPFPFEIRNIIKFWFDSTAMPFFSLPIFRIHFYFPLHWSVAIQQSKNRIKIICLPVKSPNRADWSEVIDAEAKIK